MGANKSWMSLAPHETATERENRQTIDNLENRAEGYIRSAEQILEKVALNKETAGHTHKQYPETTACHTHKETNKGVKNAQVEVTGQPTRYEQQQTDKTEQTRNNSTADNNETTNNMKATKPAINKLKANIL